MAVVVLVGREIARGSDRAPGRPDRGPDGGARPGRSGAARPIHDLYTTYTGHTQLYMEGALTAPEVGCAQIGSRQGPGWFDAKSREGAIAHPGGPIGRPSKAEPKGRPDRAARRGGPKRKRPDLHTGHTRPIQGDTRGVTHRTRGRVRPDRGRPRRGLEHQQMTQPCMACMGCMAIHGPSAHTKRYNRGYMYLARFSQTS